MNKYINAIIRIFEIILKFSIGGQKICDNFAPIFIENVLDRIEFDSLINFAEIFGIRELISRLSYFSQIFFLYFQICGCFFYS
jgi:hypothetical protein